MCQMRLRGIIVSWWSELGGTCMHIKWKNVARVTRHEPMKLGVYVDHPTESWMVKIEFWKRKRFARAKRRHFEDCGEVWLNKCRTNWIWRLLKQPFVFVDKYQHFGKLKVNFDDIEICTDSAHFEIFLCPTFVFSNEKWISDNCSQLYFVFSKFIPDIWGCMNFQNVDENWCDW